MHSPELRLLRLVELPRARLAGAIVLAACASGAAVALLAVSAWLIMRASFQPPVLWLMVAVVGVRFFGISRGVFRYAERLLSHDVAFDALRSLRLQVYAKLERLAPVGPIWRKGDLLERLVADVEALADLVTRVLIPLASSAIVFTGAVLTATLILPSSGAVLAVALLIAVVLGPVLVLQADARDESALREVRARRTTLVTETVLAASDPGMRVVQQGWLREIDRLDDEEERLSGRAARRSGIAAAVGMLALAGCVAVVLVLAAAEVGSGRLAPENAALVVMLPLGLLEPASAVQPALASMLSVRASARRLIEVLDRPEWRARPGASTEPPDQPWPIVLADADITWPDAVSPTVRGASLRLEPGARVALVGPSGAGKSTVLAALMGYATVTAGQYEIGGLPAAAMDDESVRTLYAWCDQGAHLFDTSIAENLRLARGDATDEEIRAVLERAQLGEWVAGLPRGIDTRVGQFGVLVSGGQRQRLALARALLADRPVLLVDEPTAGLDQQTADRLMDDLIGSAEGRALVVVTHEPRGLDRYGRVIDVTPWSTATRLSSHRQEASHEASASV